MQKIHVIGMGPGSDEYILPAALEAVSAAEVLFGAEKLIERFSGYGSRKELVPMSGPLEAFFRKLGASREKKCAVLVTGDPGFYSLLSSVRGRFGNNELIVIPGISAFQVACSKIGLPWQEYRLASAHGRSLDSMLSELSADRGAIILTDRTNSPGVIAGHLRENGWSDREGWICENIAKRGENIEHARLFTIPEQKEYGLCLMILQPASQG